MLRLNLFAVKMNTTLTTLYPNITTAANTTHAICRTMVPTYTILFTLLSCFLSIFGSFVIIITYINLPVIQNFARKLLLSLTVADLLTAFGNSIGSIRYLVLKSKGGDCELLLASDSVCVVQSFITTYSSMASFFWTSIIAFHIYMQIIHRSSGMRTGLMLIGYQVLCWGVPGIITITASGLDVLGNDKSVGTGSWCWIKTQLADHVQIAWMIVAGKGWEILCYIVTAGLYMMSKIAMWSQRRENTRRRFGMQDIDGMRSEDGNFLYVPLVLYVVRIWGTARFFLAISKHNVNNIHYTRAQNVLLVFQSIGDSSQAFFNCILFCFCDATVRHYLYRVLSRQQRVLDEDDERTPIQT